MLSNLQYFIYELSGQENLLCCEDRENQIKCVFKRGDFSSSKVFTGLIDTSEAWVNIHAIKMTQWLQIHHNDKIGFI